MNPTPQTDGPCPTCGSTILAGRMAHHQTWCKAWSKAEAPTTAPAAAQTFTCPHCKSRFADDECHIRPELIGPAECGPYVICPKCDGEFQKPAHAAQLEQLFGGGPPLSPTHWMEKYAKASAELTRMREVEAGAAVMRESLVTLHELCATRIPGYEGQGLSAGDGRKYCTEGCDAANSLAATAGRDLLAEVATLRLKAADRDEWQDVAGKVAKQRDDLLAEVEKLLASEARLRSVVTLCVPCVQAAECALSADGLTVAAGKCVAALDACKAVLAGGESK